MVHPSGSYHTFQRLLVVAFFFLLPLGCRKPASPPAPPKQPSATPIAPAVPEPSGKPAGGDPMTNAEDHDPPADQVPTDNSALPADVVEEVASASQSDPDTRPDGDDNQQPAEHQASNDAAPEQSPPIPVPRLILFTRDGPLLISLDLRIHGQPLATLLNPFLDAALQAADTDADQRVLWSEIAGNEKFLSTYLPGLPVDEYTDTQWTQFINLYDANRNGRVDRFELPKLLAQGEEVASSLTVLSSNEHRDRNGYDAPLLKLLDTNDDQQLAADELAQVAAAMRSRDFDGDDVYPIVETPQVPMDRPFDRGNEQLPAAALRLGANDNWNAVHHALRELYGAGGPLTPNCFALTPTLFAQLDTNGDSRIAVSEFQQLTSLPPHVRLTVDFTGNSGVGLTGAEASAVRCDELEPQLAQQVQVISAPTGYLELQLPTTRVVIFARDIPVPAVQRQSMQLFADRDANSNGYLERDEFDNAWADTTFDQVDLDHNDMVFPDELLQAFERRPNVLGSQVHARVGHVNDVFAWALDQDRDGQLGPREMDQSAERLQGFDTNHDGVVTPDEVPDTMVLALVRGGDQDANRLLMTAPAPRRSVANNLPRWFSAMDANRDGELSTGEFLGDGQQFANLDANRDGYVDGEEALQLASEAR